MELIDLHADEAISFADVDFVALLVGEDFVDDAGQPGMANVLGKQPTHESVARDDLGIGLVGTSCERDVLRFEDLGHDARWLLLVDHESLERKQSLDRLSIVLNATSNEVRARDQDRGCMRGIHTGEVLWTQGGPRADSDAPLVPGRPHRIPQVLNERCADLLGKQDDMDAAIASPLDKSSSRTLRQQELADDGIGAARPSEDQDVTVSHHGREPGLELFHPRVERLGHDGDQRAQEDDVSEHGQNRGHRAVEHADVVAEIARIAQPQERPPDGLWHVTKPLS